MRMRSRRRGMRMIRWRMRTRRAVDEEEREEDDAEDDDAFWNCL